MKIKKPLYVTVFEDHETKTVYKVNGDISPALAREEVLRIRRRKGDLSDIQYVKDTETNLYRFYIFQRRQEGK